MVTDTVLWLLLLAMVGWVVLGCRATRRLPVPQRHESPRDELDRAA